MSISLDRAACRAAFDRIVERFEEPLASPLPAPKQCGKTTLLDILTLPRCAAALDREHIHGSSVSRYRGDAADAALAPKPRTGRRCGRQPRSRRCWAAIDRASSFQASRGACTGALMSAGVKSMRLPSRSRGAVFGARGSRGGSTSVSLNCATMVSRGRNLIHDRPPA
jgi:hypothetical protein